MLHRLPEAVTRVGPDGQMQIALSHPERAMKFAVSTMVSGNADTLFARSQDYSRRRERNPQT